MGCGNTSSNWLGFHLKHLALIGAISLAGCGVDNSHLVQHSYTVEQHDAATGLTLQPSEGMFISFPEMVSLYVGTEACMGMTAPGPTVYFKSFVDYFNGAIGGVWGFHTGGTIYINTDEKDKYAGFPERSDYTDTETLRHEYIHNILYHVTGSGDAGHTSEFYALCGKGPIVTN